MEILFLHNRESFNGIGTYYIIQSTEELFSSQWERMFYIGSDTAYNSFHLSGDVCTVKSLDKSGISDIISLNYN